MLVTLPNWFSKLIYWLSRRIYWWKHRKDPKPCPNCGDRPRKALKVVKEEIIAADIVCALCQNTLIEVAISEKELKTMDGSLTICKGCLQSKAKSKLPI